MNKNLKILFLIWGVALIVLLGCQQQSQPSTASVLDNDSLLTLVQYQTLQYFWEGAEPFSGMARERIHLDGIYPDNDQNVVTSGGSGFGLMAILVGVKRGFITQDQGIERFEKILNL